MEETARADALALALRRIEAALVRLESASTSLCERHAALGQRHRALKNNVAEALGEIDVLIAATRPATSPGEKEDAA
ncbi:hypothetical protein I5E68_11910 [Novosphingobium sp. YJ-S2-02]|uniref:Uncharacterized protein n=1 Tax=Novosphingobium aureum TaxID=2792964 RepID=A0A931HCX9_9SPHN|nr:hypothetical protein [Novosphingobium aureum]MBH0113656.1 hypothetical protein [Novosphingobium aureum]